MSKWAQFLVEDLSSGQKVPLDQTFRGDFTVLHLLRRFGCAICRRGARILSEPAADYQQLNAHIVGVGHERLGNEEFRQGSFLDGPVYLDEEKKLFEHLGTGKASALRSFFSLKMWREGFASRQENVGGNLQGDGWQMGGTWVIRNSDGQVLFEHRQQDVADHPDPQKVLQAIRNDVAQHQSSNQNGADAPEAKQSAATAAAL